MVLSSCIELSPGEQNQLLTIARASIAEGLRTRRPLQVDATKFEGVLKEPLGNFVTLTRLDALRGCIGTISGNGPLAQDIASSAFNAAFNDSRFPPLRANEFDNIQIDISVLSYPELLTAESLNTLLEKLRPHEHGLIVEDQGHRATLLPKVWEKLPDPHQFITQLLAKAGLPEDYWSKTIRFYAYTAFSFAEKEYSVEAGLGDNLPIG